MRYHRSAILASIFLVLGCGLAKLDPEVDAFGRRLIQFTETGDSVAIMGSLDSTLAAATPWGVIKAVSDSVAAFQPDSASLIGWNVTVTPGHYQADLTYELRGNGWALVTMGLSRHDGTLRANGFHFERSNASLSELNAFTMAGRNWRHYLVLGLAFVFLIFCVGSAIIIVRTPMPRRWLWALGAFIGLGQFGINWSTGEMFSNPLRFQLLCAAAVRPGLVAPWLVSFALPVGAGLALLRRHQFLSARAARATPEAAA